MASKRLTFGTLPTNPNPSAYLWCKACDLTFSCDRGDYFQAPQDLSPRCERCTNLLRLVRRVVRYVAVSAEEVSSAG